MQEVLNCNGAHRTYKVTGQVVTVSVHRILIWANTIKALFTICGKNRLHCWDIDDALKAQRSENDVNAHNGEVVTDLVFLRDKGLLATSSLDKKVKLWDVDNLMPRGTLQGHSLGVRCLSYAQGLLVSGAFDCKIVCWDVTSHEQVVVLEGHRRAISYVALVAETAENVHVQTLDDDGDCKYWKARSRRPVVLSRRRRASSPGDEVVGSFFFDFELFRTASGPSRRVRGTAVASMASSRDRGASAPSS